MRYLVILILFLGFIAVHGLFFQEAGQPFSSAIRERQYLWVVYFFVSLAAAEHVFRFLKDKPGK